MHLAILATNTDTSDFARATPTDAARFAAMLQAVRPDWQFAEFDVVAGAYPAAPGAFDGYIVTGSPASANDPDPWIAALKPFLRQVHDAGVPLFGACFGHQVLAVALGGQVAPSPDGWRLGAYDGPLGVPSGRAEAIRLYAAHKEQVTALPPGAELLGGSVDCPVGAFRLGARLFATQYHPEFPPDYIAGLIEAIADEVPADQQHRARASLAGGPADILRFAEGLARFFEGQAPASA